MKLAPLAVLADDEITSIHEATLHILEQCAVKIGSPRMLAFLQDCGLSVDNNTRRVRFPHMVVEDALSHLTN